MIFQMEIFAEHEVFKRPVVKLAVQNGTSSAKFPYLHSLCKYDNIVTVDFIFPPIFSYTIDLSYHYVL